MSIVGIPQDLKAIGTIRQGPVAVNLLARFEVGQGSADLFAKFEAQAIANLFAEFELAQWEDLKAIFEVGQNSADLKGILQVAHYEQLFAKFTVSKANVPYAELEALFWVSYNDSGLMSQGIDASVLEALSKIT